MKHSQIHSESAITLISKPAKDTAKKENCRSIFLTNIDAKILNKNVTKLNSTIYKNIHHEQVVLIQGFQDGLTLTIQCNTAW